MLNFPLPGDDVCEQQLK